MRYYELLPDNKSPSDRLSILANAIEYADNDYIYIDKLSNKYKWYDVTSERAASVTYTNTTGKVIYVAIRNSGLGGASSSSAAFYVDGIEVTVKSLSYFRDTPSSWSALTASIIVPIPIGSEYYLTMTNATLRHWHELR